MKSKNVLGETTLNLSSTEFEEWISKSKASPESIKRYYRAYDLHNKEKILEESGIDLNKYVQKEVGRDIARTVIIASISTNIIFRQKGNRKAFSDLKRLFRKLHEAKESSSAMTFKIEFKDIVHGVLDNTNRYISTTLYTIKAFDLAFNEIKYKIRNALNKYPNRNMLVKKAIIKFYYMRAKTNGS